MFSNMYLLTSLVMSRHLQPLQPKICGITEESWNFGTIGAGSLPLSNRSYGVVPAPLSRDKRRMASREILILEIVKLQYSYSCINA